MGSNARNFGLLICLLGTLSGTAFAQYGPRSAGMSIGSGAGYGAGFGGSSSERPVIPTIPDPTGTPFEKVGKLFAEGEIFDLDILVANPVLPGAVMVTAQNPSKLDKTYNFFTTVDTGDDVIGKMLYSSFTSKDTPDETEEDLTNDVLNKIKQGYLSSHWVADEEANALVQQTAPANSDKFCQSSEKLRLKTLEDGRRLLVYAHVITDPRKACSPTDQGFSKGDVVGYGYVVLPD